MELFVTIVSQELVVASLGEPIFLLTRNDVPAPNTKIVGEAKIFNLI